VDVPENYLSSVKRGAQVIVEIPDTHRSYKTTISQISQQIGATNRTFVAEAKLSPDKLLKANQLAIVKIQDYSVNNVIVIPITTMQTDDKGKYVFVMASENGKTIARKRPVISGDVYGENVEIKSGLQAGDKLVTQGYQGLYDGQPLVLQQ
jgi:multidrug efflux pump subunit AcrA (membrane-fusion protein)